ncbi:MAG: hypothetical protein ACYCXP_05770 [Leptospirillum sp.]|jgi:hypothetical protein|nr:hypothetical protein [Nitrospiraceae bacterium]MDA8150341.1 hypothetical protein [Nitrospiraceae bacterium]
MAKNTTTILLFRSEPGPFSIRALSASLLSSCAYLETMEQDIGFRKSTGEPQGTGTALF